MSDGGGVGVGGRRAVQRRPLGHGGEAVRHRGGVPVLVQLGLIQRSDDAVLVRAQGKLHLHLHPGPG